MARASKGGRFVAITGLAELDRKLAALEPAVRRKHLRAAMRAGMEVVKAAAQADAPVDTGALRESIKVRSAKAGRGRLAVEVVVGEGDFKGDRFYAAFVEFGTSKLPARPFMGPAFVSAGPAARATALALLRAAVLSEAKAKR